jgi:hypothetical protein
MLEKHKSGYLVTRETFGRKPLEIATSLKILRQDFRTPKGWAVRFMCHKLLVHYQKTTLVFNGKKSLRRPKLSTKGSSAPGRRRRH